MGLAALGFCASARADNTAATAGTSVGDRVVAVVNDQVITMLQLEARTLLNLRQAHMTDTDGARKDAVMKRTLSGMIDELLQRQYAEGRHIAVTKAQMDKARAQAIQALGGPDAWAALTKGVEKSAEDKLRAEVLWQDIVDTAVKPQITIGTAEVDRLITELAKSRHVMEREISVIMLPPGDTPDADKEQLAEIKDIRAKIEGGADFAAMARAHSSDKSAVNGGDMGWFSAGELNPQLEQALDSMQPGQVSGVIRTPTGWYLVRLDNVRATKPVDTTPITEYDIFMLATPLPADAKAADAARDAMKKAMRGLDSAAKVKAYFGKAEYAKAFGASEDLGWMAPSDLQADLQAAMKDAKVGAWTPIVTSGGNLASLYLADSRKTLPSKLNEYRARVMQNLFANRVDLQSRRFMQDLREKAFVDVRL